MKFQATFKSPDSVYDGVFDALEQEDKIDNRDLQDELMEFSKRFVWFGEFITVEFDTELGTCTVLPSRDLE